LLWVAEQLEYGIIVVLTKELYHTLKRPYGIKESGFQLEGSKYGIEDYLDYQI